MKNSTKRSRISKLCVKKSFMKYSSSKVVVSSKTNVVVHTMIHQERFDDRFAKCIVIRTRFVRFIFDDGS